MATLFTVYVLACLRERRLLPPRELWTMARGQWSRYAAQLRRRGKQDDESL